ncbi:hypothetical protein TCCBUS3UF1_p230 (plasmid) [Thermus sp. CCB_US3_UF1]|nr:hypothetical protein TCCBUS3UF1_p230 [Thermus sp. CCB_US3_UF1]
MAESRYWAVGMAPVIRRETRSPFQVPRLHRVEREWISASFEVKN